MRILGIDPGTQVAGYGVIDVVGPKVDYVECGVLKLGNGTLHQRLKELGDDLGGVLDEFRPDEIAMEASFSKPKNYQSALKLSMARGIVVYVCAGRGLEVKEFAPSLVKKALSLSGNATKSKMQAAAQRIFRLEKLPPSDAADALGIAVCRAATGQMALL